ncbi:MAG: YraN family protein [Motiliproteus sp.]
MSRQKGKEIEDQAQAYLLQQGLKPVQQNYLCRGGEIDIIMQQDRTLVFVEVRFRNSTKFGNAAESVNWTKQQKLIIAAQHFLQKNARWQNQPCRFDVIACNPGPQGTEFQWIRGAFDLS